MGLLDIYLAYCEAVFQHKQERETEQRNAREELKRRQHQAEEEAFWREFIQTVGVRLLAKLEARDARALPLAPAQEEPKPLPPSPKDVLVTRAERLVEISRAAKELHARYAAQMDDDPELREALTRLLEASRIEMLDSQEVA